MFNFDWRKFDLIFDELTSSDCFALVLLSHGNQGTVYAYDAPFPTQKLWEPFTVDNSPSLGGKPKLIFLQVRKTTFFGLNND